MEHLSGTRSFQYQRNIYLWTHVRIKSIPDIGREKGNLHPEGYENYLNWNMETICD